MACHASRNKRELPKCAFFRQCGSRASRGDQAIARSNRLDTAYDGDALSQKLDRVFSDLFETEVRAFWVLGDGSQLPALAALSSLWWHHLPP